MDDLHRVERSDVAGVPVFRVETPGPSFAMLEFRVGRADEPLTHAGITHVAEHLAFHQLHHLPYEHNGITEPTFTRFFAEGEPEEVEDFVRAVVAALVDPPLERVGREARILGEEAAGRNSEAHDLLGRQRFGTSPHGRPSYPEYGLWWLDADAVGAWVTERFNRGNAALVVAGAVADDRLGLERLPEGQRFALPWVDEVEHPRPWHVHGPDGVVLGTLLIPRGASVGLAVAVIERELEQRLRHQHGLVYETISDAQPLDLEQGELVLGGAVRDADAAGEVAAELGRLLSELAVRGPDTALLDAARRRLLRSYRDPFAATASAVVDADSELTGYPIRPLEEDVATIEEATPDIVAGIVAAAAPSLLLTVPEGVDLDDKVFGDCELSSTDHPVHGTTYREARIGRHRASLVVGEDAVGLRFGDGSWWRLPFDDVAAVCWYEEGSRELMTGDGLTFSVEPTDFRRGHAAVATIDARLPQRLFVPLRSDGSVAERRLPRHPAATVDAVG